MPERTRRAGAGWLTCLAAAALRLPARVAVRRGGWRRRAVAPHGARRKGADSRGRIIAPARVLQAARRLARRAQQKRVRPGQTRMQHAELPGLEPCEAADRGEIRAHQREVVMAIRLADAAHALECGLVADVPAERVTGI